MARELGDWQARLATHFAALRERRLSDGLARPVFGLEHGLDSSEVQALEDAVRADIAYRRPSRAHALVWIVYSSELGYRYSGDEYWQTFERETPGWVQNGNRHQIRTFYSQFHRDFGGAVPSGVWAEHFSIICWPITHAILPKDLQRQLARTLYESRHSFSGEVLGSPESLGALIAARSWSTTSRFQNFAQEKQLVGQIAAALLLQGEFGSGNLIHPATLGRIGADVDRERQAREWLKSARQSAGERVKVRGLGLFPNPSNMSGLDEARAQVAALGIEPRLVLRPTGPLGGSWDVSLEIPDLSHLLLRFPQTEEILPVSRCTVAGYAGNALARGRLLHGTQRVLLARWPQSDEVLLQFEQTDPQLDFLLSTECLLRPGPNWLFRIASDGLAYECRNLRVRPGERYILANTDGPVTSDEHTSPIDIVCEGVEGALLDLPQALTVGWEESLRNLGLGQARTVEVWPAGLAPIAWDGEGYGEWLASEAPCLAILSDHPLASLIVSMDSSPDSTFELTSVMPGEPVFVEFPQLPVGVHRLHFEALSMATGQAGQLGNLDVVVHIRAERPRSQIVNPLGPLSLHMDPATPTLEQLWEGRLDLSMRGPYGRDVECTVSLLERDGEVAIIAQRLPPISAPFTSDDWQSHFRDHFQERKSAQEAYDRSRVCTLAFSADELGAFTVRCERDFTPLRWAVRRRGQGNVVRLYDDRGQSEPPLISRATFETPCVEEALDLDSEYEVPDSGGMYVARADGLRAAVVVPPALRSFGLEQLRFIPNVERQDRSVESVLRIVGYASQWGQARLPGDLLSAIRQRNIMLALVAELFRLLCGEHWATAEKEFFPSDNPRALEILSGAVSRNSLEAGVGATLFRDAEAIAHGTNNDRIRRLASVAVEYHLLSSAPVTSRLRGATTDLQMSTDVDAPAWLTELSLRLASDPTSVETWAGRHLHAGLNRLLGKATLARAARFLVIATDRYLQPGSLSGELLGGWRWS